MTSSQAPASPLDYQVIQRRSWREGIIPAAGSCNPPCERVEIRLPGGNDAGMSTNDCADGLAEIISDFRTELGRCFPFSVSPEIRAAQQLLWERGIALQGPDTDTMLGDPRDCGGKGIHFSKKGLKVHGEAWARKVVHWLDGIMHSESLKS